MHGVTRRKTILIQRRGTEIDICTYHARSLAPRQPLNHFVDQQVNDGDLCHACGCCKPALAINKRQRHHEKIPSFAITQPADEDKEFLDLLRMTSAIEEFTNGYLKVHRSLHR